MEQPKGTYPIRRIHGGPDYVALILDMDGLLLDTEVADRRAWRRAAEDYGCSVTDADFERVLGRTPAGYWLLHSAKSVAGPRDGFAEAVRLTERAIQHFNDARRMVNDFEVEQHLDDAQVFMRRLVRG